MVTQPRKELYSMVPDEQRERFFRFVESQKIQVREINGVPVRFYDIGDSHKPALLVLTGGLKFPFYSFSVIDLFLEDFRVIAPAYPPEGDLEKLLRTLYALLQTLKVDKAFCLGTSWGGCMAQVFAHLFPDTIQKLVLANTGMPNSPFFRFLFRLYLSGIKERKAEKILKIYNEQILKLLTVPEEQAELWKAIIEDFYPSSFTFQDYKTLIMNQGDYLNRFAPDIAKHPSTIPCLIITSKNETAGSAKIRENLISCYPAAVIKEFEGGGHAPPVLFPEEYKTAVLSFLRDKT